VDDGKKTAQRIRTGQISAALVWKPT